MFKNHNQIEDSKLEPFEIYFKSLRVENVYDISLKTSFGHIYSSILEIASKNSVKIDPEPESFLDFIREDLIAQFYSDQAKRLNFNTPCYYPSHTNAISRFLESKGLDKEIQISILEEAFGPENLPFEYN